MIRAVIVDDEQPAIERLRKLLSVHREVDVIGEAMDGLAALDLIEEKQPDLVFLDIDMPELNGLEVARTLGVSGPLIIFVTAYDEHALEAFESSAIDYLVKPVNTARLGFTIEKVRKSLARESRMPVDGVLDKLQRGSGHNRLAVKIGTKYEVIDPSMVSVALARDHYTSLIVEGREFLIDDSLDAVLARLDPSVFIRVHRSAILNIKFLKELRREGDRKYTAVLADQRKSEVSVSRERLPILRRFLGLE